MAEDIKKEGETTVAEEIKETIKVVEESIETTQTDKQEEAKKPEKQPEKEDEIEIEVPKNLKKLVEEIENLKVVDLAVLVKVLEKKFGVSAASAAMTQASAQTTQTGQEAKSDEKKFFNVSLSAIGDKKIEVIKAIRDITQRGLKESKDLVDKAAESPQIIKENAKKEEAEEIKTKLEKTGAKVELK